MLYDTRRFVFTVSLCAMLAVNPVLATVPGEEELVSAVHDVYTESTNTGTDTTLNLSSGIAGVTYVNRMVNSAGNAAQRAEDHAAAAGSAADAAQKSADAAQKSADDATETLTSKLDISQGTDNKDKVMVVGSDGNLTPGMVGMSGIADGAITMDKIGSYAVTSDKIAGGAVTAGAIADGAIEARHLNVSDVPDGSYLRYSADPSTSGAAFWGKINMTDIYAKGHTVGSVLQVVYPDGMVGADYIYSDSIADDAITADKIADGSIGDSQIADNANISQDKIANLVTDLALKLNVAQGTDNKDKVMVVGSDGNLTPGMVGTAGIADGAVTSDKIGEHVITMDKIDAYPDYRGFMTGAVLMYNENNTDRPMYWGWVDTPMIAPEAIKPILLAPGAVTMDKIDASSDYYSTGGVLMYSASNGSYGTGADSSGSMYWGQVNSDMIAGGAVRRENIDAYYDSYSTGGVLMYRGDGYSSGSIAYSSGSMYWGQVNSGMIADGAVTASAIADGAIEAHHLNVSDVPAGSFLRSSASGAASWGRINVTDIDAEGSMYGGVLQVVTTDGLVVADQIGTRNISFKAVTSDKIADGAVTPAQTAGGVGTIPWGSADSTTYGQFWIE